MIKINTNKNFLKTHSKIMYYEIFKCFHIAKSFMTKFTL